MTVQVNGVTLYYEVAGRGAPLLLVHGNGEDHTIFAEAARVLQAHFTCYLLDSRGHGQSSAVQTLDYEQMADDVLAFAQALGMERLHFYGFSDGGIIGLIAAAKAPALFETLIVSGANLDPRGVKDSVYYLLKLCTRFSCSPKLRLMLEQPHITDADLHKIRARTLVLAGSKDLIKEAHTRRIARNIPGAALKLLPGESHGSYIVHSEKIAQLILEFCGTADRGFL